LSYSSSQQPISKSRESKPSSSVHHSQSLDIFTEDFCRYLSANNHLIKHLVLAFALAQWPSRAFAYSHRADHFKFSCLLNGQVYSIKLSLDLRNQRNLVAPVVGTTTEATTATTGSGSLLLSLVDPDLTTIEPSNYVRYILLKCKPFECLCLETHSWPSISAMALLADSSSEKVTKPKPLERLVSRSMMTLWNMELAQKWSASKFSGGFVAYGFCDLTERGESLLERLVRGVPRKASIYLVSDSHSRSDFSEFFLPDEKFGAHSDGKVWFRMMIRGRRANKKHPRFNLYRAQPTCPLLHNLNTSRKAKMMTARGNRQSRPIRCAVCLSQRIMS
jgi:hypothetical protein